MLWWMRICEIVGKIFCLDEGKTKIYDLIINWYCERSLNFFVQSQHLFKFFWAVFPSNFMNFVMGPPFYLLKMLWNCVLKFGYMISKELKTIQVFCETNGFSFQKYFIWDFQSFHFLTLFSMYLHGNGCG